MKSKWLALLLKNSMIIISGDGRWEIVCQVHIRTDGCALQFELTTLHIISFLTLIINLVLQDDSEISLF